MLLLSQSNPNSCFLSQLRQYDLIYHLKIQLSNIVLHYRQLASLLARFFLVDLSKLSRSRYSKRRFLHFTLLSPVSLHAFKVSSIKDPCSSLLLLAISAIVPNALNQGRPLSTSASSFSSTISNSALNAAYSLLFGSAARLASASNSRCWICCDSISVACFAQRLCWAVSFLWCVRAGGVGGGSFDRSSLYWKC